MTDDEIIKENRDTLLERMSSSGNAYSNHEYPYGLMSEAEEEIKLLRKERDEARREVCESEEFCDGSREQAKSRGWDCYEEPVPLKRKTLSESDPRIISIDELEQTIRNSQLYD